MDPATSSSPASTPIPRYRLRSPTPALHGPTYTATAANADADADADALPLPLDDHATRPAMSNAHRRFHRRASPVSSNVLTVKVEVIATLDAAGNVVPDTTVTQTPPTPSAQSQAAPSAPSTPLVPAASSALPTLSAQPAAPIAIVVPLAPAVPSPPTQVLPSVPAVPPFPSDLTVPAYPWPSGVPPVSAVAEQAVTSSVNNLPPLSTSSSSIESNSTKLNTSMLSSSSSLLSPITSLSTSPSASASASASPSSPSASPSPLASPSGSVTLSSSASSAPATVSASSPSDSSALASASASFYGGGGAGWGGVSSTATALPTLEPAAGVSGANAQNTTPLDTPQVVGSVVGSLAGAALILAIILLLIRRHKRKQSGGALQLAETNTTDDGRPMGQVQAPAQSSLVPAAFLNRFSSMSRSTVDTTTTGTPSFQRVSGRKLPSAFSEGMTSDQFARGGALSGSSFYQDDHGTYGGPGLSKEMGGEFAKEIGDTSAGGAVSKMNMRPSPARTPVIRHPEENPFADSNRLTINPFADMNRSTLSPPQSPNPEFPNRAALGRSLHSADGSRSSRFTENV